MCVQPDSPTQANTPVPGAPIPSVPHPVPTQEKLPRFQPGDIIDFSQNIDKEPHLIILDYNNTTREYQYDVISRTKNKSWGYRVYPDPQIRSQDLIEKEDPYLIAHINISEMETWFPSKEIFEKTT